MNKQDYNTEEILNSILKYVSILKKNIKLIALINIIFITLAVFLLKSTIFRASSEILLKNNSQSQIMSFASNLGFGSGNNSTINFGSIKSVASSDLILRKLMLTPVKLKNNENIFINHYIDLSGYKDIWIEKNPDLIQLDFSKTGFKQDSVLTKIIENIRSNNMIYENQEGLVIIETENPEESLAFEINKNLVSLVISYFEDLELKEKLKTKNIIKHKMDSIQEKLLLLEQKFADLNDKSINILKSKGLVDQKRIERELTITNGMYLELKKQFEVMNFEILNATLPFNIIKSPIYPLKKEKTSLVFQIIFGFILANFFIIIFVGINLFRKKIQRQLHNGI